MTTTSTHHDKVVSTLHKRSQNHQECGASVKAHLQFLMQHNNKFGIRLLFLTLDLVLNSQEMKKLNYAMTKN